jgi:carboxyl-terminal processing protease
MGSEKSPMETDVKSEQYSKETIKDVQEALKAKGHEPGAIDGTLNQKTQQALRDFQQKNNLTATGNLNQETARKLGVSLDDKKTGSKSGAAKGNAGASSSSLGGKSGATQKK